MKKLINFIFKIPCFLGIHTLYDFYDKERMESYQKCRDCNYSERIERVMLAPVFERENPFKNCVSLYQMDLSNIIHLPEIENHDGVENHPECEGFFIYGVWLSNPTIINPYRTTKHE